MKVQFFSVKPVTAGLKKGLNKLAMSPFYDHWIRGLEHSSNQVALSKIPEIEQGHVTDL